MEYQKKIKKNKLYIFLIRWWSVGAVYFFIGWGTQLGSYEGMIDFVLALGIAIGLFHSFVVHPVLKDMFSMGQEKKYTETTVMEKVSNRLLDVVIAIFIVYLVMVVYSMINITAVILFSLSSSTVILPGEPILFGLFYTTISYGLSKIVQTIKRSKKQ